MKTNANQPLSVSSLLYPAALQSIASFLHNDHVPLPNPPPLPRPSRNLDLKAFGTIVSSSYACIRLQDCLSVAMLTESNEGITALLNLAVDLCIFMA